MAKLPGWNNPQRSAEHFGHHRVNGEAVLRNDHLYSGPHQRVAHELNHFIRAISKNDILRADSKLLGEFAFEVKRISIRIKV